jgi:phospholipid/cholesterol/gamma-HCH transport system substrate-binding protein
MQSVKSMNALRNPVTWGAAAIAFGLVVALVLAYVYYHPPGQSKVVSFYTDDAASVRVGDEVRMAGIAVGKVKKIALEPKQVKVTAVVDDDAFVGDRSQIDVRMLTVVGGYYVNLVSIGDTPLGAAVQPRPDAHRHDQDHPEREYGTGQGITRPNSAGSLGCERSRRLDCHRRRQCHHVDDG